MKYHHIFTIVKNKFMPFPLIGSSEITWCLVKDTNQQLMRVLAALLKCPGS
jgi:hypothetical protein